VINLKIFKNRGDIYISKSNYKSSREERILVFLLIIIVIFTIVFVAFMSHKYTSVSEFFAEGEVSTTQAQNIDDIILPSISGKTNYLIIETDDEESTIHYIMLIQSDGDSLAYKVSALSPNMKIDNESLIDLFEVGGGAALQTKLTEYLGIEIDYYAQFKMNDFIEFANKMGSFVYPSNEEIRYTGGSGDDTYTIHINEGEQNIDGKELSNLLRYYSCDKVNYSAANEVMLYALTEVFNQDNYEDCESLFRMFIRSSVTNVTVRDFENGKDVLQVFCYKNTDITVYNTVAVYEKNALTQSSMQEIKGYFSK
jgi:anionic cell wall polymer biosynthesis LytR-Cps2A-Psr (LCP) family protein